MRGLRPKNAKSHVWEMQATADANKWIPAGIHGSNFTSPRAHGWKCPIGGRAPVRTRIWARQTGKCLPACHVMPMTAPDVHTILSSDMTRRFRSCRHLLLILGEDLPAGTDLLSRMMVVRVTMLLPSLLFCFAAIRQPVDHHWPLAFVTIFTTVPTPITLFNNSTMLR
jgi:hypothetical protein